MSAQNTPPAAYDDEIDLYELWEMLVSRKWTAIGTALVIFLGGTGYALTQPTLFEYQTIIRVATAPEPVRPVDDALFHFQNVVFPERPYGRDVGIAIEKQGNRRLILKSRAKEEEFGLVERVHTAVADDIMEFFAEDFERLFQARMSVFEAEAGVMERQIALLEAERARHITLLNERDDLYRINHLQRISDIDTQRLALDRDIVRLDDRIQTFLDEQGKDTEVEYMAIRSANPVGTQPRLIIALAAVLGVMLGIFLVFVTQFFANAKKARSAAPSEG